IPVMADRFAAAQIPYKDSGPVRLWLEESGRVSNDGSEFRVKGTGYFAPGSAFSNATIEAHQNFIEVIGTGPEKNLKRALAKGKPVRCAFKPGSSFLNLTLPKALGGGNHDLHLVGGFTILPVNGSGSAQSSRRGRS